MKPPFSTLPRRRWAFSSNEDAAEFSSIAATLTLVFSASVGFGVVTPVLPAALALMPPGLSAEELAWHTGLLTGVYTFMGFGLARLWGQLSDRVGRRPVLLTAAAGHIAKLSVMMMPEFFSASSSFQSVAFSV